MRLDESCPSKGWSLPKLQQCYHVESGPKVARLPVFFFFKKTGNTGQCFPTLKCYEFICIFLKKYCVEQKNTFSLRAAVLKPFDHIISKCPARIYTGIKEGCLSVPPLPYILSGSFCLTLVKEPEEQVNLGWPPLPSHPFQGKGYKGPASNA